MTMQQINVMFDVLQELYGSTSESTLAQWGLQDRLITRYEYRRGTGREAPVAFGGLITDDSREYYARRANCTCGDCSWCCGSGDEDDRTDEEKNREDY